MKLFDTHCHFDVSDFDPDRQAVAEAAWAAGVKKVLVPGYVTSEWPKLFSVCQTIQQPELLPSPGLHPCYINTHEEQHLAQLEACLKENPGIVAIGEIGLDYFLPELKAAEIKCKQLYFFQEQLKLATSYKKPVILHIRKAHHDVIHELHQLKFKQGGIAHAFSGGIEEAKHLIGLGFKIGIGGGATYTQSKRLRQIIKELPLDALVLETDAPDMIPQPYRQEGKPGRNSPEYLPAVAQAVAEIKGIHVEHVAQMTWQQATAVLRMGESK